MDFMKNKAKFQEDPDTGITFDDVAVSILTALVTLKPAA